MPIMPLYVRTRMMIVFQVQTKPQQTPNKKHLPFLPMTEPRLHVHVQMH